MYRYVIHKINWFAKISFSNLLMLSKDEAKLVFKDICRLYNGDRIF
jgi:hypothetical protein